MGEMMDNCANRAGIPSFLHLSVWRWSRNTPMLEQFLFECDTNDTEVLNRNLTLG
jgi:hypothetical protein